MVRVTVYTTTYCPYCTAAKELLDRKGISYEEVDVTGDRSARDALVEKSGGRRTVPQIFVGERPLGGFTELAALDKSGELDRILSG